MRMLDLIEAKRDGREHAPEEVAALVDGFMSGRIPDYQVAAWLMAVVFRGLTLSETAGLTRAMRDSGRQLAWTGLPGPLVDKHSTGGVADSTTLLVVPVLAALGLYVPKLSGRALGHTGGTIDKLEAIPGLSTRMTLAAFERQVRGKGLAVMAQTEEIAPADGRLYALRDATATVSDVGLIAASILSKKLAAGAEALILDVKTGSGAFLPDPEAAERLARTMISIGKASGLKVAALVTDMSAPLGASIGNALEVAEAAAVLRGEGLPASARLRALSLELAARLHHLALPDIDLDTSRQRAAATLADGSAFERLLALVAAQGGDARALADPARLPRARLVQELPSPGDGFVARLDARDIGRAAVLLGAGRAHKEDAVDPAVGLVLLKAVGDAVGAGEPWAVIHASDEHRLSLARPLFERALTLSETPPPPRELVLRVLP
jgi:pyrimidine-nucleoside phosphorylase/thymidine phosphorylase